MFKKDSILLYSFGGSLDHHRLVFWVIPRRSGKATRTSSGKLWQKFGADKVGQVPWLAADLGRRLESCGPLHHLSSRFGMEGVGQRGPAVQIAPAGNPEETSAQRIRLHGLPWGQGFATDMESAHGFVEHWDEP